MQRPIKTMLMRGGTSRGPFFLESDLPSDPQERNRILLEVMGSPDKRQIDGLGGANPLTSKVGIVSLGKDPGVDLNFLFAQVMVDQDIVDTSPNCGNMLAAVVPFALETGLLKAQSETTTFRVLTLNTGMQCDITVQTPNKVLTYDGLAKIDGVPGFSAPIKINFLDTAGSVCSGLLPTGHVVDTIDDIEVTCIDNGMPMVLMRARDLSRTGYESVAQLNADTELKKQIEVLRLKAGVLMGLGDVLKKSYPKMCLIAPPKEGGSIATRCFIPHVCHEAVGVLAAVTIGSACILEGSVARGIAKVPQTNPKLISVEHPTGEFTVELEVDPQDTQNVTKAALLRTARMIMRGEVMVSNT
ncbi:MAG: 4-oxalomesaconate tautomerase [Betaproteobacteria bacterium]